MSRGAGGGPPCAEIVTVGSELLVPGAAESHADWLGERLARSGIAAFARVAVVDDEALITAIVDAACRRSDVVIVTGGLGPTEDDRTRAGVARALGVPLERDPERLERLRERLERFGLALAPDQARQAELPRGAQWIEQPLGSAAGFTARHHGCLLAVLPGPPAEMHAAFEHGVAPQLVSVGGSPITTRAVRLVGPPEPVVDRAIRDLYAWPGLELTILSGALGVVLQARVHAGEAQVVADRFEAEVRRRFPEDVWGIDGDTLPEVVGQALVRAGRTVAVAESCTGGLLSAALTSVGGSSAWFRGGLVVYADDLKRELAGVDGETLRTHGAVSAETVLELAQCAAARARADLGLGVSGIAGPGGGTEDKPVGLVHLALADGDRVLSRERLFPGDRTHVRQRAVTAALDLLRRHLAGTARG